MGITTTFRGICAHFVRPNYGTNIVHLLKMLVHMCLFSIQCKNTLGFFKMLVICLIGSNSVENSPKIIKVKIQIALCISAYFRNMENIVCLVEAPLHITVSRKGRDSVN